LYIQIREVQPDDSIDIEEGVTVDVDENSTSLVSRSSMPVSG
jgi:uncharacterized protein YuzE